MAKTDAELKNEATKAGGFIDKMLKWYNPKARQSAKGGKSQPLTIQTDAFYDSTLGYAQTEGKFQGFKAYQGGGSEPATVNFIRGVGQNMIGLSGGPNELNSYIGGAQISHYLMDNQIGKVFEDPTFTRYMLRCYSNVKVALNGKTKKVTEEIPIIFKMTSGGADKKWTNNLEYKKIITKAWGQNEGPTPLNMTYAEEICLPVVFSYKSMLTKGCDEFLKERIAPILLGADPDTSKYLPKIFMEHLGNNPSFSDDNERRLFLLMGGKHYGANDIPYLNIIKADSSTAFANVPTDVRDYWKKHYTTAIRIEEAGTQAGAEGLKQLLGEEPNLQTFAKYITHGAPTDKEWGSKVMNYMFYSNTYDESPNKNDSSRERMIAMPFVTSIEVQSGERGKGRRFVLGFPLMKTNRSTDYIKQMHNLIYLNKVESDIPQKHLIPYLIGKGSLATAVDPSVYSVYVQDESNASESLLYDYNFPNLDSINSAPSNLVNALGGPTNYLTMAGDRFSALKERGLDFSPDPEWVKESFTHQSKGIGITNGPAAAGTGHEVTVFKANPNPVVLDDVYKSVLVGYNESLGKGTAFVKGPRQFAEPNETILDFEPSKISKQLIANLKQAIQVDSFTNEESVHINDELVTLLYEPLTRCNEMIASEYARYNKRVAKFKELVASGQTSKDAIRGLNLGTADAVPASATTPEQIREYYILQLWIDAVNAASYKAFLFLRRSQFNVETWIRFTSTLILNNQKKSNKEINELLKAINQSPGKGLGEIASDVLKEVEPPAPPTSGDDDEEEDIGEAKERLKERRKNANQCLISTNIETLKHKYHEIIKSELKDTTFQNTKRHSKKDRFTIHREAGYGSQAFGNRFSCLRHTLGDHGEIPNLLVANSGDDLRLFLNGTPEIQSALVPKIRLFRVTDSSGGVDEYETEFTFKNFSDPKEIIGLSNGNNIQKGQGGGIKSFTWTYEGGTPATAKKDINAELTLYFQSFAELTKKRGTQERSWRYIDLLLYPTNDAYVKENQNAHPNQYNPTNFRIRADVGWHVRKDIAFRNLLLDSAYGSKSKVTDDQQNRISALVKKAKAQKKKVDYNEVFRKVVGGDLLKKFNKGLRKINKSLLLNMIDHDIDFRNDGSVELKITYAAYAESMARSSLINALSTPEIEYYRQAADRELYDLLKKSNCRAEEINAIRSEQSSAEKNLIVAAQSSIVSRLTLRGLIRTVYFDKENADNYLDKELFGSVPKPVFTDKFDRAIAPSELPEADDLDKLRMVKFFFLGDLMHTILDCLFLPDTNLNATEYSKQFGDKLRSGKYVPQPNYTKKRPETKNFIPLLSSFIYSDYNTKINVSGAEVVQANKIFSANIADMPISVDYFNRWLRENVIKPERTVYPLMNFIRDIVEAVIELLTDTCINKNVDSSLMFQTQQIRAKSNIQSNPYANGKTLYKDVFRSLRAEARSNPTIFVDVDKHYNKSNGKMAFPLVTSDEDPKTGERIESKAYKDYMLLYAVSPILATSHQGRGIRSKDEQRGTFHFLIGNNKGLLKNIKFSKTDMAYLREARYYNQGNYGLLQLGAVYNVDLELFGNTIFYPGMEIFIDPRSFGGPQWDPTKGGKGRSIANALGIGGYHTITRVTCTISPSGFTTSVQAVFQYSGDISSRNIAIDGQAYQQDSKEDITEAGAVRSIKCVEAVDSAIEQSIRAEAAQQNSTTKKYRF